MRDLVGGVVVTFNPAAKDLLNIAQMQEQVDFLVIVDNGPQSLLRAQMRSVFCGERVRLIENEKNCGVATALNQGVREIQAAGCRWVVLFDQDSALTPGFVATLLNDFLEIAQNREIAQIVPRYKDPVTNLEKETVSRCKDGGAFLTITSGSLFSLETFERCGLFRDELFVYCVDDDYSLRLRANGFYIGFSSNAVLLHLSGQTTYMKILGRTIATKNYRPEARYYYARNKVWLLRRYGVTFPRLILPTVREFLTIPLKILLMEQMRWSKISMFLQGMTDGMAGRMGPLRT